MTSGVGQGCSGPPSRSSETWPAPCPSCLRLPRCERAGGEVCPANYPDYQCCCCYSRACPRGVLGCVEIRPPARGAWLNLPICIILILVISALGRRRSGDMQRACKGCQPQRDPNPGRHGEVTLSPHICRCQEVWGGSEGPRGRPSWGSEVRMMGVSPLCLPTELHLIEPWDEAGGNQFAQGQQLGAGRSESKPRAHGGEGRARSDTSSSCVPSAGGTACHLHSQHLTGETVVMTDQVAAPSPLGLS